MYEGQKGQNSKSPELKQRETSGESAEYKTDWVRLSTQEGFGSSSGQAYQDKYSETLNRHIEETNNLAREQEEKIFSLNERYTKIFDNPKNKDKISNLQDKYYYRFR